MSLFIGMVAILAFGQGIFGSTSRSSYSSTSTTTEYTLPSTSSSYSSSSSYKSPPYPIPASGGYSSYSSWSSSSGHGGGGGSSNAGFVIPSSGATSHTSSTDRKTYSSSGNTGGYSAGFVTPSSSYANSLTKGSSSNLHLNQNQYSVDESATSFTSGGRGGIDITSGGVTPSTGYSNYASNTAYVQPASHTSSSKYSSSSTKGSGVDDGFVTPSTPYSNYAVNTAYVQPAAHTSSSKYSSSTSSSSSSTKGSGVDAGFRIPSTGYSNYASNSGYVQPASHATTSKYSSSSSTKGSGVDDGFVTPTTGYTNNYGGSRTSNAGFVVPASGYPSTSGGQSRKYVSTTTTTTTEGVPYNPRLSPEHLSYVPYGSHSSYQTNTAYGNSNSLTRDSHSSTNRYNAESSKTKTPVYMPASGSSFSSNGQQTSYNTQYIYRETSRSSGRGAGDSAEEQEMVGRLTSGGAQGTQPIILYEHIGQTGRGLVLSVPRGYCLDVPTEFNDLTSSVNTYGHCFWLCQHSNCFGSCKKFAPGVGDSKYVGDLYNDHITSVKQC